MSAKICVIDQFANQLTQISNLILEQPSILRKAIAIRPEDQRNIYMQNLHLLKTEIIEDKLIVLEKEVAEVFSL